jgi:aminoglycoside phosphotransferase (APT) family kinase protein
VSEAGSPSSKEAAGLSASGRDPAELRAQLQEWLRRADPQVNVVGLDLPEHTGVSSLTAMLDVAQGGRTEVERLVVRIAPDSDAVPVFPNYDLEKQYLVLDHLARTTSVPVPRLRQLELDTGVLGVPFFLMERIEGDIPPDIMPYPFGSWLTEASLADQRRLQETSLRVLAQVHAAPLPAALVARLAFDRAGSTALERHVAEQRAYYEWSSADAGVRASLLEAGFDWLEAHWPAAAPAVLSWGDARIGNIIFQDFEPAALLDWEMVGMAPAGVDLGWMIFLHRWFDDMAVDFGLEPMRHFMRVPDALATYQAAAGEVTDLRWYLFYAALRHGIIMFRVARRPIAQGLGVMPDDPNDLIMHRATLEAMLAGEYWAAFEA